MISDMVFAFRKKKLWLGAILFVLALCGAELSRRCGSLDLLEHAYTDLWHRLSGVRHVPEHVVLVSIDDQSLAEHADDPLVFWTPYIAEASANLQKAGVKVIGLDMLFAVSSEGWLNKMNLPGNDISRVYDAPFRAQINSGKMVLAGSKIRNSATGQDDFLLPHRDFLLAIPDFDLVSHIGLADFVMDGDGIVRSFVNAPTLHVQGDMVDNTPALSLSTLLAVRAEEQNPRASSWRLGGRLVPHDDTPNPIVYAGPPGTFPRISLSRLLKPDALSDPAVQSLKGKTVIVGGEFVGMNDFHFTPYSGGFFTQGQSVMSGPEVQANIAETLLSGIRNRPLSAGARLLYMGLLIGVATFLCLRLSPWGGLIVFAALSTAAAAFDFFLFKRFILAPLAPLQAGLAISYLGAFGVRLISEERERSRVTQMFGSYVSDDVVELLLSSRSLPDLGGESLPVTILFSDIRNFTTCSEKLNAHEVVEMLNEYFQRACEPVLAAGGSINKFIGDAIMVQFGSPVRHPDHALRAIRTALALKAVAEDFKGWMAERFAGRGLPEFAIGVGIHTGEAVIGNIGTLKRKEFTAIGDTVNIASRLEGMTKAMNCTIVASAQTLAAAGAGVKTGKHEWIQVKGREEAIEVFEVIDREEGKE